MRRIVVGVDGSPSGARALDWALRHAQRSGAVVDAVHVYRPPVSPEAVAPDSPEDATLANRATREAAELRAGHLLDAAVRVARSAAPGVGVREVAIPGRDVAAALLDRAKSADLLVVGTCGMGRRSSGSTPDVSRGCVSRPPVPVVVVPSPSA